MSVTIPKLSRLQFANLVMVDGRQFWDLPTIPELQAQDDDIQYQWDELDVPELVSNQFYNDTSLFWIIAKRNGLSDWPGTIQTGDVLVIPSARYIFEDFFSKV
jgi:hypothetical protein